MRLKYGMILVCSCILAMGAGLPSRAADANAESAANVQLKDAISDMVTIMTGVAADMSQGVQDGARKVQEQLDGADGVRLIGKKDDLASLVRVDVLKVERPGEKRCKVTLAVRNDNDFPVRLVNLRYAQSVVLLDAEGFAYVLRNPAEQGANITVPARASIRANFVFEDVEGTPSILRLHDVDFRIP
ncbi:hypothetical protein FACS1894205_4320 [Alphaproteobacteria bacterium]|nr:hypothetical protein FACS1894205_4320 [Alphaproteobacteria bacterium]